MNTINENNHSTLVFNSLVEAWSVLYDELGRPDKYIKERTLGPFYASSPRGRKCNELIGANFIITDPRQCLMFATYRHLSPIYLAGEYEWYLTGSRKVEDAPSKVWKNLKNTNNPDKGLINSNYGHYLFKQFDNKDCNKTVWQATKDLLIKDSDTRQAIIQIPIMNHRQDLDTPCTSSIQFLLRDNKLNCIVYMRSCDLWFGLPNDVTQFILWQMRMAKELDVELGYYQHICGSLHVYEENFITKFDEYLNAVKQDYIIGKENIKYFKFYDDRNYKDIVDEITFELGVLNVEKSREFALDNALCNNESLKYMLKNMKISKFIH